MAPEYLIDLRELLHQSVSIRYTIYKIQNRKNVHTIQLYNFYHCCNKFHNIFVVPNPINSTGIIFENTSRNSVRIIWEVRVYNKM